MKKTILFVAIMSLFVGGSEAFAAETTPDFAAMAASLPTAPSQPVSTPVSSLPVMNEATQEIMVKSLPAVPAQPVAFVETTELNTLSFNELVDSADFARMSSQLPVVPTTPTFQTATVADVDLEEIQIFIELLKTLEIIK